MPLGVIKALKAMKSLIDLIKKYKSLVFVQVQNYLTRTIVLVISAEEWFIKIQENRKIAS